MLEIAAFHEDPSDYIRQEAQTQLGTRLSLSRNGTRLQGPTPASGPVRSVPRLWDAHMLI